MISGIDGFNSLTNSIRVALLGHTNLEILQSLQILLVFGVFNRVVSIIIIHGKILFIPKRSQLSDILYFLKWCHQPNLRGVKKGERGMVSLKGIFLNKLRREER